MGSHNGKLRLGFSQFDQAMGVCRTPSGIAVGSRHAIWTFASCEIAPSIGPEGEHDIAFLARSCHRSGPVMGHDLAWGNGRLWLVNTLNGLVTIEGNWSFVPQWKPPFIGSWAAGDRCHLGGLAQKERQCPGLCYCSGRNGYRTWLEGQQSQRWLLDPCTQRRGGGARTLHAHSPMLYKDELYVLNSGHGALLRVDPKSGAQNVGSSAWIYARTGLFCWLCLCWSFSDSRNGSLWRPPYRRKASGVEVRISRCEFEQRFNRWPSLVKTGIQEAFAVTVLPGWRNLQ